MLHPIVTAFIINFATLSLKILGFVDTRSSTLFADVLNDLGDCIGLLFLFLGLYLSKRRKSSIAYPFGMSRAIYVFGLISISIVGGILFAISLISSLATLASSMRVIESKGMAIIFVFPALTLNVINMIYSTISFKHKKHSDPATLGAFVDGLTDLIGSIAAVIAIVLLNTFIDGIGSMIVSIVLLVSSISLGYRYFIILIGRAPPKEELIKILNTVISTPGVLDVNELRAIMLTENEYLVILEVETDIDIDIKSLEIISQNIESEVRKAVNKAKYVVVECVPKRREPPTYRKILDEIRRLPR